MTVIGGVRDAGVAGSLSVSLKWRRERDEIPSAPQAKRSGQMDMTKYIGGLFLKVDDVRATGAMKVKIVAVSEGRYDKPDLTFDDGSKLSCNATNGRALARAYGFDSDDWCNKEVELVVGEIEYQGKAQEAILVNPISPPIENKASPKPDFNDEVPF